MSSVFKPLWSFISLWLLSSPLLMHQAVGSVSHLNYSGYQQPDLVVELDVTNFSSVLKDSTANHTIIEFLCSLIHRLYSLIGHGFVSPACRRYKPEFEKVARLFNGAAATYPDTVLVTRVDCAIKANTNICDKFSVTHYPMLFWGTPSGFAAGSIDGSTGKSEIRTINDGRTAHRMLKWINTRLGSSYIFKDDILYHGKDEHHQSNVADSAQQGASLIRACWFIGKQYLISNQA
uniref:Sulfhydryl oxidase 2-like isoform X2 n=1 Tax=Tanacetum cinerariifolium TaxID=118510 RepID=A0A699JDD1_TANCI|nr:sulfhydryl oxidase 2-like isoform X2 [Tanacetum cinerariifolium]